MNEATPTLDDLLVEIDSKYSMVIIAAKRARQILEGSRPQAGSLGDKPVTAALKEIVAGKLAWEARRATAG